MIDIRVAIVVSVIMVASTAWGMILATDSSRTMKKECEKDLARNLNCEMVYVKPSIEG
jgi:hypothetical protein